MIPTRGYGVLAEWMLIEAGISQYLETEVNKGAYAPFYFLSNLGKKIII